MRLALGRITANLITLTPPPTRRMVRPLALTRQPSTCDGGSSVSPEENNTIEARSR